ncbi:hypothetical protein Gorai_006179 [Gossypium raimondii]|uniref:Uncharacterized protein n=1 Tax=Gossypium raimondii TaxID=29730 RepID=A0A7J8QFD1_GOSRA|nr:hypothetical protein [Gossypium raimondii]
MDIENGYFLPKFNNKLGYKKVLSKGLSGYMYKNKILVEIEGLVGKVANLGPKVGLFWSRKQTNSPRPLDYGSFLNLRENNLVLGIKLSQEIGSSTGLMVSEDLPIHYLAVEKFGRQQQSVAAITGSEIKVWTSDGGSVDSELIILNGGNSCALESLARLSSTLQGLAEVPIADSNGGLNPNRHTTITFKEVKNSNDGVSTEGGTISILGVENFKTLGKILGEKVGGSMGF